MLKYVDVKEVFAEIPDEITLAVSISGCPIHCPGCHSRYLWDDVGEELSTSAVQDMIDNHYGVTCICFMGGDNDPAGINELASYVRANRPKVRTAWYSGKDEIDSVVDLVNFDYIKTGPYDMKRGPLTERTTNQVLWKVSSDADGKLQLTDITSRFWNRFC